MKLIIAKLVALAFNPPAEVREEIKKVDEQIASAHANIRKNSSLHTESIGVVRNICKAEIEVAIQKRDGKISELEASYAASNGELRQQLAATRENGVVAINAAARQAKVQKLQARLDALRTHGESLQLVPA